jgi:hypothetical protein
MGYAGSEVTTDKDYDRASGLILPDNVERPAPPMKQPLGFSSVPVKEREANAEQAKPEAQ